MKKIILTFICFFLFSSNSHAAFMGLSYDEWNATLGFSIVGVPITMRAFYRYMKDGQSSTVDSGGNIKRPSEIQWIDTKDLSFPQPVPAPTSVKEPVNAEVDFATLKALGQKLDADGNPLYPNVNNALNKDLSLTPPPITQNGTNVPSTIIGSPATINGSYVTLGSYSSGPGGCSSICTVANRGTLINSISGGYQVVIFGNYSSSLQVWKYYFATPPPPVKVPTTAVETSNKLQGKALDAVPSTGSVSPAYQAELDKMLQDPEYVPVFSDATTGLPYAPPPSDRVATPEQVDLYNKTGASIAATGQATTSAEGAVTAATGAVGNAQTALAGNPTDPSLIKGLDDALRGLAEAQASLDKLKAEQATADAENAKNGSITAPDGSDAYGDGKEQDFSGRFNTFMSDMKSSSLFSLPSQVLGNIPSGGQSSFYVDFGRFGNTTFDLASFSTSIDLLKTLVLIVFSVSGFYIVALKGGSG